MIAIVYYLSGGGVIYKIGRVCPSTPNSGCQDTLPWRGWWQEQRRRNEELLRATQALGRRWIEMGDEENSWFYDEKTEFFGNYI